MMGKWSESLIKKTRSEAYPGAMMKSLKGDFGMMSARGEGCIKIVGVRSENYMPVPTGEVIAEYKSMDEMLAAGWAID
ncbi:MAG: hypothetical protein K6G80_01585 [Treponema sp.]|nr:hypothetical protein [Treponema sp.]